MNETRQQDIIWVKFPYSDMEEAKFRPALVVSNDSYNNKHMDIIICAITSNIDRQEFGVMFDNSNLISGKIYLKSKVRADKIMPIEKTLAVKSFARLNNKTFDSVIEEVTKLMRRNK